MTKIVTGETAIPQQQYMTPGPSRTRSKNNLKFAVYRTSTNEYKNSFFPRTIVDWNASNMVDLDNICFAVTESQP